MCEGKQDQERRAGSHGAAQGLCQAWSGMVLVKSEQDLFDLIAGLFGFSPPPEAITELPRFLIEICPMPLKPFDRTIPQDEEVGLAVFGHPSLVCWGSLRL
jgi:hypothetical protein